MMTSNIHSPESQSTKIQVFGFPLISSPHPDVTKNINSLALNRLSGDGIDLRFEYVETKSNENFENYILGRIWVPLNSCNILFESVFNFPDESHIDFGMKFDFLENKCLSNDQITIYSHYFDYESSNCATLRKIFSNLSLGQKTAMSLSRLYWRLWGLYYECIYWEEHGQEFEVSKITHQLPIEEISSIEDFFKLTDLSQNFLLLNIFFVNKNMMRSVKNRTSFLQYINLLLSKSFMGEIFYGINTCWPELKHTKFCLGQGLSVKDLKEEFTCQSFEVYSLINWFAAITGQSELIQEIGNIVASFLYRPEGDSTFMGHEYISIKLPLFCSIQTIMYSFSFENIYKEYGIKKYRFRETMLKGIISYMLMSLTFNSALCENNIQTLMQLKVCDLPKLNKYIDFLCSSYGIFYNLNIFEDAQIRGNILGWGNVWNKITSSITIMELNIMNFNRILQWSDWLIFENFDQENFHMSAIMSDFIFNKPLDLYSIQKSTNYKKSLFSSKFFYVLSTYNLGNIYCLYTDSSGHTSMIKPPILANISGYPLDGQFQDLIIKGLDINIWWNFEIISYESWITFSNFWKIRKNYIWTANMLNSLKNYCNKLEPENVKMNPISDFTKVIYNEIVNESQTENYICSVSRCGTDKVLSEKITSLNNFSNNNHFMEKHLNKEGGEVFTHFYVAEKMLDMLKYWAYKRKFTYGEEVLCHLINVEIRENKICTEVKSSDPKIWLYSNPLIDERKKKLNKRI